MTKEKLDNIDVYKFSADLTPIELCEAFLSDADMTTCNKFNQENTASTNMLKSVNLSIWINANDYLTKKVSTTLNIFYDPNLGPALTSPIPLGMNVDRPTETYKINFDLNFLNYGIDQKIVAPTDAVGEDVIQSELQKLFLTGNLPVDNPDAIIPNTTPGEDYSGFE